MRALWGMAVGVLFCGCGPDAIAGSISGKAPFLAGSAVFLLGAGVTQPSSVIISSQGAAKECADLDARIETGDAILISGITATGELTVVTDSDARAGKGRTTVWYLGSDARIQREFRGTLRVSALLSTDVSGTFEVSAASGDKLNGRFAATPCP